MPREQWSKREKTIARRAFEQAYARECSAPTNEVRRLANGIAEPDDIRKLHNFLTRQRKALAEKDDFRYSVLLFVFARLVGEGWIREADLVGPSEDKLNKIRFLVGPANR